MRSFGYADGRVTDRHMWEVGALGSPVSFGQDANGELYVVAQQGRVYRLVAGP